ncbi:hypothetical protein CROQUDRAFT_650395 [Cronartium quercuum f. sp. fusiforme G11]|uniref:Inosine/uridine-preferring nucleoside hydrolase domain-containing protein n=1 Tax=Cronartium quercuum f. sp. fusiforme G11 TaxID=708437 RepID=A0A9P6NWX3_9BASI|nr:hypothetical protein CROQUDRAFT_650395 [Cronartium quercuum f. sp. fusiforme G11]
MLGQVDNLQPIWLDCDPGHDDAIAILLSLHLPGLALMGISTVGSNADVHETTKNAARLVHAFGGRRKELVQVLGEDYPLQVITGAAKPLLRSVRHDPEIHGSDGLAGVEGLFDADHLDVQEYVNKQTGTASDDLITVPEQIKFAVRKCKEKGLGDLIIVVCGGMTNIALFASLYPSLLGVGNGVKEVVFMGGAIGIGNRGPTSEFNVLFDPEAVKIVFDSKCKVVMIPLNVTHQAIWHERLHQFLLNPAQASSASLDLKEKARLAPLTPLRQMLSTLFDYFKKTYLNTFGFEQGPPIHDALCLFYLIEPSFIQGKRFKVEVECNSRWCDGTTVVDIWGDRDQEDLDPDDWSGSYIWVAQSIEVAQAWKHLFKVVHAADLHSPLNHDDRNSGPHLISKDKLNEWVEPNESILLM